MILSPKDLVWHRVALSGIVTCLFLLFGCGGSAKFVGYEKPDLAESQLAQVSFENASSFETRLWTFNDPLVCNEPVVKSVVNGVADDLIQHNEIVIRHGVRGQPFSFYVGFFSGATTQWREIRQIVTFVPGEADYKIILGAVGDDGRLKKGGFAITKVSQGGMRPLEDDEFIVRRWQQAAMMGTGWAAPLTADE